jgi:hypothetical protein
MEFTVELWAKEFELENATIEALAEKGFKSKRSLSKLHKDLIKKEFKGLTIGQQLLLVEAAESLQSAQADGGHGTGGAAADQHSGSEATPEGQAEPGTGSVAPTGGTGTAGATTGATAGATAGATMGAPPGAPTGVPATEIWNLFNSNTGEALTNSGKPLLFDPLGLNIDPSMSHKAPYRDLRDFVHIIPKHANGTSESQRITLGAQEFVLNDRRPSYDSLDISQYMEASMRILREMCIKDNVGKCEMLDYVNYIIKIATLCQSFKWDSVLKYDLEYRKAQAEMGFRWGADNSYLMQLLLKTETVTPKTSGLGSFKRKDTGVQRYGKQEKYDPQTGMPICKKWNDKGCDLQHCRYAHVCLICYSASHTRVNHGRVSNNGATAQQHAHNDSNSSNAHTTQEKL